MIDDAFDLSGSPPKPLSVKEGRQLDVILSRRVEPEERDRLERILLNRIKSRKEDLHKMLVMMSDHWTYRIFIILLLLALGGGGWGYRRWGYASWSPAGLVVLIPIILLLTGGLR